MRSLVYWACGVCVYLWYDFVLPSVYRIYKRLNEEGRIRQSKFINLEHNRCFLSREYYRHCVTDGNKGNSICFTMERLLLISNLFLGAYTDAFGRKFLLAVGIIGTCIRLSIRAIFLDLNLIYLLIACFVEGITGQYATHPQTSLAYIAITKPGKLRIFGIIFIEFIIGIGLSSASFLTGFLIE